MCLSSHFWKKNRLVLIRTPPLPTISIRTDATDNNHPSLNMLLNGRYLPPPKSRASCQLCQDLMIRRDDEDCGFLGIPLSRLPAAANSGCFICRILHEAITELMKDFQFPSHIPVQDFLGFTIRSKGTRERESSKFQPTPLSLVMQTEIWQVLELEVYCPEGKIPDSIFDSSKPWSPMTDFRIGNPTIWPLIGPARDVSRDGSAAVCMDWTAECIKNCLGNHSRCLKETNSVLPHRLISVGDGSKDPHLWVNDKKAQGKYVALSHSWGGHSPLCLTNNTLSRFQQGIPWKDIPATFRDAMQVCRLLNIKYIWIDSLCIIQDSPEDWRDQAAQMCDYYSNSWITIAADGALNSSHGFLNDKRRNMNMKRFKCPGVYGDSEIRVRRKGAGGLHDSFSHHYWAAPSSSPLSSRGWILQESLLAPRILHFTVEELTWECLEESRCECQVRPHHFEVEKPLKLRIDGLPFQEKWATLVDDYTNRSLTKSGDKLLAISGLARRMQNDTKASYWAGLWSDTFPSSLLWSVLDRYQTPNASRCFSKRIVPFQAPTWSWASVTGRVLLKSETVVSDLEGFSVSITTMGNDPYGSLKSASITANAFLSRVNVQKGEDGYKLSVFTAISKGGGQMLSHVEPDVQDQGYYDIKIGKNYWILLIGHTASSAHCILIREIEGHRDVYERVGLVYFFDLGKFKAIATKENVILI